MASVGGNAVDAMRPGLSGPQASVSVFLRAGVAGHGLLVGAAHGVEQEQETDLIAMKAACLSFLTAAEALVGTVVSVTDSDGVTFGNCSILGVAHQMIAIGGVAGADTLLRIRWRLIAEP